MYRLVHALFSYEFTVEVDHRLWSIVEPDSKFWIPNPYPISDHLTVFISVTL